MSTPIPPPLRAAAGLAALAIDTARKVPQQLVGLPVLAVSTALQASLKAQQAYAGLVARGDEVLGQLRGVQDAPPWARFDDEPAGARPPSAFDTAPEPTFDTAPESTFDTAPEPTFDAAGPSFDTAPEPTFDTAPGPTFDAGGPSFDTAPESAETAGQVAETADRVAGAADGVADALAAEDLADTLAAEDLADTLTAEAAEEAAIVEAVDRDLDPDMDADVVALAEARAGQAEADAANVLGETEEDELAAADAALADAGLNVVELDVDRTGADRPNGRPEGSGTEPGIDMPADGMALAADAAAAGAALAADSPATGSAGPPVAGYDDLSIPQLRGRLRSLTLEQIEALVAYERATRARPPYLTMLQNRLTTLRSR